MFGLQLVVPFGGGAMRSCSGGMTLSMMRVKAPPLLSGACFFSPSLACLFWVLSLATMSLYFWSISCLNISMKPPGLEMLLSSSFQLEMTELQTFIENGSGTPATRSRTMELGSVEVRVLLCAVSKTIPE